MQLSKSKLTLTIETKIGENNILDELGKLYGNLLRKLYRDILQNKKTIAELKSSYIKTYKISARMFNALHYDIKGKIKSHNTLYKHNQQQLKCKIEKEVNYIKKCKNKQIKWLKLQKLQRLKNKYNKPLKKICFGGRRLLRKINENAKQSSEYKELKQQWLAKRNGIIYLLGSKDEKFGNQLCQLQGNKLRLRLPDCLASDSNYVDIPVKFKYHNQYLNQAIQNNTAMTYKFIKQKKRGKYSWYCYVSFSLPVECKVRNRYLGIDINYDRISTIIIDDKGNPVVKTAKEYKFDTENKTSSQITQILSNIASDIVERAKQNNCVLGKEKLKIKNKSGYNRVSNYKINMLVYNKFNQLLYNKALKNNIMVKEINPAYTSIIGKLKYSKVLGINTHTAAAIVIARRCLGFKDKCPSKWFYFLPGRIVNKHHWTHWAYIKKTLKTCLKSFNTMTDDGLSLVQFLTLRFNPNHCRSG